MQQYKKSPFLRYIETNFDKVITKKLEEFVDEKKDLFLDKIDKISHISEVTIPESIDYKTVSIENDPHEDILKFDVAFATTVNVTGYGRYGMLTESIFKWFVAFCEGNLSSGLKKIDVVIDEYSCKSRFKNALNGDLVPIIKREQYDAIAESIILKYYDKIPRKVKIIELANRMGLKVYNRRITKDASIFGQIYFTDSYQDLYDEESDSYKKHKVKANSIYYDEKAIFLYAVGSKKLTIAHECVHYAIHKKAFLFAKLFDKSLEIIQCETAGGIKANKKTNAIEWMERQANAIAPYIIMPTKTFTKNVKDIVTKYECYSDEDVVNHIEKIIEELAEYYGVTIYAARNRLIDIGYDEARGAFNWVDNHYVPPYLFRKGTLKKSESFSIDYKDIAMKLISNKDTRELICCNDLVFVENHVCINDKKYITKDDTGNLILTYYARMNMDECCIKFVYKEKGKNDENGYGAFCYLCRDANQGFNFEIDISLDKNGRLADKLDTIKRSEQYFKDIQEMRKIGSMSFTEALNFLKEYLDVTNDDLEIDSGLDERTIRRYLNGENKVPDKKTVIALCRGLRLPIQICDMLMKLAGHTLNTNTKQDDAYFAILTGMMMWTPKQVNQYLVETGFEPLTKEK